MAEDVAVIFDLETTDNDPNTSDVVQLGAVTVHESGHAYSTFQTYCRPDKAVSQEALNVHGIGPDKYWLSPHQTLVLGHLKCYLDMLQEQGHRVILGGFNSERFDVRIIDRILPAAGFMDYPHLDPACFGPRCLPSLENHKLTTTHRYMYPGAESEQFRQSAHDAVADCWMVAQIISWIRNQYSMSLAALQEWTSTPVLTQVCWFGAHKGVPWDFVPRNYLNMMANKFQDMSKDQAAVLKHYGVKGRYTE